MSRIATESTARDLSDLFAQGTLLGCSDAELLLRFREKRDERAFRALVEQYGPMVRGVCRGFLTDEHLADDAFQATFLVLVRKAGSIHDPDRLGPWLHGVATRVARKARAMESRRRRRETAAPRAEVAEPESLMDASMNSYLDCMPLVHEEVGKLPARYRDPLVFCLLNGQTYEGAARRLKCPVGTIKGRLWRARRMLRDRLARLGVALSAPVLVASLKKAARAGVPEALIASTVNNAIHWSHGAKILGASALAGTLAERTVQSMFLSNLKVAAAGAASLGLAAATTLVLAQGVGPNDHASTNTPAITASTANGTDAAGTGSGARRSADESNRVKQARARVARLGRHFEDGNLNREQYLEAVEQLKTVLLEDAADDAMRLSALSEHVGRLQAVLDVEKSRSQRPNTPTQPSTNSAAPPPSRAQTAREFLDTAKAFYENGTITLDRYISASALLKDAELASASQAEQRQHAIADHVARLQEIESRETARFDVGTGSAPNVAEVAAQLESARAELAQAKSSDAADLATSTDVAPVAKTGSPTSAAPPTTSFNPVDDPANAALLQVLRVPTSLQLGDGASLKDLVAFIRESTKSTDTFPNGLQVYVDPKGLEAAEMTMESPVAINLAGVSLERSLYLALRQLGLAYTLQDGLLIISTPVLLDQIIRDTPVYSGNGAGLGGMGGGYGGMGMGGMGGGGFRALPISN